jgi:hypothetical protein
MEYLYAFVSLLLQHSSRVYFDEAGAQELLARCDLRSIADAIRDNERAVPFRTGNDPLLRAEDLEWAVRTFGDRARLFETGDHFQAT